MRRETCKLNREFTFSLPRELFHSSNSFVRIKGAWRRKVSYICSVCVSDINTIYNLCIKCGAITSLHPYSYQEIPKIYHITVFIINTSFASFSSLYEVTLDCFWTFSASGEFYRCLMTGHSREDGPSLLHQPEATPSFGPLASVSTLASPWETPSVLSVPPGPQEMSLRERWSLIKK